MEEFFIICVWWNLRCLNDYVFNTKDFELDSKVFVVSSYLREVNSTLLAQNIVNSGTRCYTT